MTMRACHFISVIIPVFNDQKGLNACLTAISNQNYPKNQFEVIVVDNGSTPPIYIDEEFSGIARLIICEKPGAYSARNAGAIAARGDVLAFTDADCQPEYNWLNCGMSTLMNLPAEYFIGGEVQFGLSTQPTSVELYQYTTSFLQRENIEEKAFSATANLFVWSEQFQNIGTFCEHLLSGGDREWSWRAISKGYKIKFAPDAIVKTMPRTSITAAIRQARRIAGGRFLLNRLGLEYIDSSNLKPHRGTLSSALWILSQQQITLSQRVRILAVATILKFSQLLEKLRLTLGTSPERQ